MLRRPLQIESAAAARQQCGQLHCLDAADFFLICPHRENRRFRRTTEFGKVRGNIDEHAPADAGAAGGARSLWKSSPAYRLKNYRVGPQRRVSLDRTKDLRALGNRVVSRKQYLQIHSKA